MSFEVEYKFRIKDAGAVKAMLKSSGCIWSLPKEQADWIYCMPNSYKDIFWRIREEKEKTVLSVKKLLKNTTAVELETSINDSKSVKRMLELSGFDKYAVVKKLRTEGSLNGFNICLDEVCQLGCFIEIEKNTDEENEIVVIEEQIKELVNMLRISTDDVCKERYHTMIRGIRDTT